MRCLLGGAGGACPVTARLAALGCSRGPSRLSRCAVSRLHGPLAAADVSGSVPAAFSFRLIPRVPVDVDHERPETSRVPLPPRTAFRSPDAAAFFEAACPDASPLPGPSPSVARRGAPVSRAGSPHNAAGVPGWDGRLGCPSCSQAYPASAPPSPRSTGGLRRGAPPLTTTRLAPVSRQ